MNTSIEEKRDRVRDALTTHLAHKNLKNPHIIAAELAKKWPATRIDHVFALLELRGEWTTHKEIASKINRSADAIHDAWRALAKIDVTDGEQTVRLFRREYELRFRHSANGIQGGISFRLMQSKPMTYSEVRTITETTHTSVVSHVENYRGADAEMRASPQATVEERRKLDDKRDTIRGATGPQLVLSLAKGA